MLGGEDGRNGRGTMIYEARDGMDANLCREGFFNILHSCKLARQLGLEAWLSGIEKRHEVDGPGEVYEVFLLGDIREVLGQLLERVKRWQT